MESGEGARMTTAKSSAQAATDRSALALNTQPRRLRDAVACAAKRAGVPVDPNAARIIKIIIFSIKFDKFTGFFDKFLKNNSPVNHYNTKIYFYILVSPLRFRGKKKFPALPHFPATARICTPSVAGFAPFVHLRPLRILAFPPSPPGTTPKRGDKAKDNSRMETAQNFPRLFTRPP